MKLLLVNGNTTQAVTDRVLAEARRCAAPGTEVTGATARFGVSIVSTEAENDIAAHAVLDTLSATYADHDAAILAISFDTALAGARQILPIPVIGMTEAALHTACLLRAPFWPDQFRHCKPLAVSRFGAALRSAGTNGCLRNHRADDDGELSARRCTGPACP